MSRLGKKRSKLGEFLDKHGVTQGELIRESRISKNTLTKLCREDDPNIRGITKQALIDAIKSLTKKNVKDTDFWT